MTGKEQELNAVTIATKVKYVSIDVMAVTVYRKLKEERGNLCMTGIRYRREYWHVEARRE